MRRSCAPRSISSVAPRGDAVLRFAWYGDDFTGASDTLATLAQASLRAMLFLDVPTPARLRVAGELDAIGIAGATRSIAPDAIEATLVPVAAFFAECGAPVLHYKVCSTFDSAPHVGNIAIAVHALHARLTNPLVLIVGGQPSLGRHCVFGHLFASDGSGAVFRIDRHPTMSRHPVTPMHEADLRDHLGAQGLDLAGLLDWRTLEAPVGTVDAQLDAMLAKCSGHAPIRAVLVDVLRDANLAAIGRLLWERGQSAPLLTVGASSVAQALIDYWQLPREHRDGRIAPASGPVFVLAGSMSPLTARQIEASRSYVRVPLDPVRLAQREPGYAEQTAAAIAQRLVNGHHVLAHTTPLPGQPRAATAADTASKDLALASGQLLHRVLALAPVKRVGVAGGDTSSHCVQALAPWGLSWLGRPAPGVALCRVHADDARIDALELMLKGGQMGDDYLFERLVAGDACRHLDPVPRAAS